MEEEILFKVLLLGNTSVGKTSFLQRYCDETFTQNLASIGFDSKIKDLNRNNKKIKLRIYDTAGQERFRSMVKNYYKGADGIILMYDVTEVSSYNDIKNWIESIKENLDLDKIGFIVVENKCDLEDEEKKVTNEMREEMEKKIGFEIIKASAKTDINVTESFNLLIDNMLKIRNKNSESVTLTNTIKIGNKKQDEDKKKKGDCCLGNKKNNIIN